MQLDFDFESKSFKQIEIGETMEETAYPRRYAKACDACHRKKIRCDYQEPACDLCQKLGLECKFTRIEKANPKNVRRGRYFASLEQRMKEMEVLLEESRNKGTRDAEERRTPPLSVYFESLHAINSQDPIMRSETAYHRKELRLPAKYRAVHLAQGYFASFNHLFPIFDRDSFMQRMQEDYPPDKNKDRTWYTAVVIVLCCAHRLRAMSTPGQAGVEDDEACRYLRAALDMAPMLTYSRPTIGTAQALLAIASTLRGVKVSDPTSMLVAAAVRMLQHLEAHKDDRVGSIDLRHHKERERAFWVAYILDKDNALQTRTPSVLSDHDISRPPLKDVEEDGIGVIRSLDSDREVNLFAVSQRLASIQGRVWSRVHSALATRSPDELLTAQDDLNPVLAAWKNSLPFAFNREDLVGHWPKYAIVQIVVLHFRYFQTLVELNKVPPLDNDDISPLSGNCPVAKSLPSYPHSTSTIAVEAARDALDLASLTPRGNFQNVWLFFNFSISAVLTLLVNANLRPLSEHVFQDVLRVDVWLRVIDDLATASDRPDLMEKKDFLARMRQWTLAVVQEAHLGGDWGSKDLPCLRAYAGLDSIPAAGPQRQSNNSIWDAEWLPELSETQFELSPANGLQGSDIWDGWPGGFHSALS